MSRNKIIFLLGLIVFVGLFLRIYQLGEKPFTSDEFLDINAIYGYYKTGAWQAWDFNNEEVSQEDPYPLRDKRSWTYRWQVAQVFRWFPATEASARSISVIWGIISIFVIYFAAYYFYKRKTVGLICAFLFAVSVSGIITNRTVRMYAMFLPAYLLFSWFLFRFLEEKYDGKNLFIIKINEKTGLNLFWVFPVIVTGLLSWNIHYFTLNIIPVLFLYLLIQLLLSIKNNKQLINKYFALLALIFLTVMLSLILFNDIVKIYLYNLDFFRSYFSYFEKIAADYGNFPLATALAIFGIYYFTKKHRLKKEILWISLNYFVILFMAVFIWAHCPTDRYLFFVKSFEIMLVAAGVYGVADFLRNNAQANKNKIFVGTIILFLAIIPNFSYFFQKSNIYKSPVPDDELDYRRAFQYISKHKKNEDVLVTRRYRNYYWRGQHMKIFNTITEKSGRKIFNSEDIKKIVEENKGGWILISDDDKQYIDKKALKYIEANFEKIKIRGLDGEGGIYRWQK